MPVSTSGQNKTTSTIREKKNIDGFFTLKAQ